MNSEKDIDSLVKDMKDVIIGLDRLMILSDCDGSERDCHSCKAKNAKILLEELIKSLS